ncbi:transcriptional regulator, TetR family [Methanoregula boonei 6A8]|jgi:AcrR family transcriptional regulator|uniref:Transcriptional regulator, TetR family n=1 Tax=Methanoregula boonei (strain DSM 21154 / JCM 14090 / 6A8) TaxID=456442 RepID=A7I884_METB6|nr:TetR/AcrR family transcriptional regulator [Methanoregula boonei]ABS55945.1 transcriptional regulator, TetR family [Methanoregula boonei 6A8]
MAKVNKQYREDAKERIIAAAIEVAGENGWDAVTLDAIAQKVGVTIPALYHYYKNCDALLDEVILKVAHVTQLHLEAGVAHEDDIHQIIRDIADLTFNQKKYYGPAFIQLLAQLSQHPKQRKKIARIFKIHSIILRDALIRAKAKGDLLPRVDPDEAVRMIFAISMGISLGSIMMEEEDTEGDKRIWINAVERCLLIAGNAAGRS